MKKEYTPWCAEPRIIRIIPSKNFSFDILFNDLVVRRCNLAKILDKNVLEILDFTKAKIEYGNLILPNKAMLEAIELEKSGKIISTKDYFFPSLIKHDIVLIQASDDFRLDSIFNDKSRKIYNATDFVASHKLKDTFGKFVVDENSIIWNSDTKIDFETLYKNSKTITEDDFYNPNAPRFSVFSVKPTKDYKLDCIFNDKSRRIYDGKILLNQGVAFAPLKDLNFFMQAHIDYGTVAWNDNLDIAEEELYRNSRLISTGQ